MRMRRNNGVSGVVGMKNSGACRIAHLAELPTYERRAADDLGDASRWIDQVDDRVDQLLCDAVQVGAQREELEDLLETQQLLLEIVTREFLLGVLGELNDLESNARGQRNAKRLGDRRARGANAPFLRVLQKGALFDRNDRTLSRRRSAAPSFHFFIVVFHTASSFSSCAL